MIRISFILPCYNVVPYIGRCLDSIENQDVPQSEYEVICVDDCSTDETRNVIKDYQTKFPNIQLICHTENKTAGGARNTGIEAAKGEYLWFVDPDDTIVSSKLSRLLNKAKDLNLDLLLFNANCYNESGSKANGAKYKTVNEVFTGVNYTLTQCSQNYLYEVASHTCCLYKNSFLNRYNLRYPEIKSSQDVVFVWSAILQAERVSSIAEVCYNVHRRVDSTTGIRGKLRANAIISASLLYINELDKLQSICTNETLKLCISREMRLSLNDDSRKILHADNKELKPFYDEICKHADLIDRYKYLMNRKTKIIFEYHLPYILWRMAIWTYKRKK